jgi:hypothetical protein
MRTDFLYGSKNLVSFINNQTPSHVTSVLFENFVVSWREVRGVGDIRPTPGIAWFDNICICFNLVLHDIENKITSIARIASPLLVGNDECECQVFVGIGRGICIKNIIVDVDMPRHQAICV